MALIARMRADARRAWEREPWLVIVGLAYCVFGAAVTVAACAVCEPCEPKVAMVDPDTLVRMWAGGERRGSGDSRARRPENGDGWFRGWIAGYYEKVAQNARTRRQWALAKGFDDAAYLCREHYPTIPHQWRRREGGRWVEWPEGETRYRRAWRGRQQTAAGKDAGGLADDKREEADGA